MTILDDVVAETREFARVRDWERFHTAKNLAVAVVSEAGELAAEFRWRSDEESTLAAISPEDLADIRHEMADVFIFLLRLSDVLEIDLAAAAREKLHMNESRFPPR